MYWYRMCVVAEGGRIYSFGEKKRVGITPFQYVCVLANKGGKSTLMYCTVYTLLVHNKI